MKNIIRMSAALAMALSLAVPATLAQKKAEVRPASSVENIEQGFKEVPESVRAAVYWYWLNNNISKEGVVKDLEAMKRVGITRAFIGNQATDNLPYGNVPLFSDEWLDITRQALKTADELGIEIGIFNCPGWSQSGGPWVKQEQSMKYVETSRQEVRGDGTIQPIILPDIAADRIISVMAFPSVKGASQTWKVLSEKGGKIVVPLKPDKAFPARTLSIQSTKAFRSNMSLSVDGKVISSFLFDRHNTAANVGFKPLAPCVITLPGVIADEYLLTIDTPSGDDLLVTLSEVPSVEKYADKSLAKVFQDPLPMWDYYMWGTPAESDDKSFYVDPSTIVNLTGDIHNGRILWKVPEGDWTVMTAFMQTTGVTNAPAVKEGTGLEIDKLNKGYIASHFDAFIGDLLRKIPPEDRKAWKVVVEDSYETGSQNWTDDMAEVFRKTYGYDPLPYLPILEGIIVGSADQSDRFLWDLRRLVADRVAYDYVGGLREECHKNGMESWLENYGHWGFPGEFLMYGGQSDQIAGEYWSEGSLGDIENRAASSCGHTYGKNIIWAESCTAGGNQFGRYPRLMKQRVDHFFCQGINATLLHLYIQQPDDVKPGLDAWFGNEFNRNNSWFDGMDSFISYLRRCNWMLRQGQYVADAAYFIGEDAPKMTGVCDPPLPKGYSFDYINAEILKGHSHVTDGKLVLDSGMEYRVLVLPRQETMRPEVLECISNLVKEGLTVLGPAPVKSPSLQDYGNADKKVRELAGKVWNGSGRYGKGRVYPDGTSMETVFSDLGIVPDFSYSGDYNLEFIHRSLDGDGAAFFVSNQNIEEVACQAVFRVDPSLKAELWEPASGTVKGIAATPVDGGISVDLDLDKMESVFVVFRKDAAPVLDPGEALTISMDKESWGVSFASSAGNPAFTTTFARLTDWKDSNDDRVKYFSGNATYANSFTLGNTDLEGAGVELDLGEAMVLAKVKVNGQDAGGVWTWPYRLDISGLVREGANTLEVTVYNNWKNRLIRDDMLPENERKTWTNIQPWKKADELQSSGLLGPVKVSVSKMTKKP